MLNVKEPFYMHNHTDASNLRLRDSINKTNELIDKAVELGLKGVAITDHECLSNHLDAFEHVAKGKKKSTIPEDFTIAFGNEIYLVDEQEMLNSIENKERVMFNHFVLIAKDKLGYEALKRLSTHAWHNEFTHRGMQRVPTYKSKLEEIMKKYKGHVIASTACLGGELPQLILEYNEETNDINKMKIHKYVNWLKNLFGDDLYFELQPSYNQEQIMCNGTILDIARGYDVKPVITTDAHYLSKEDSVSHKVYLNASQGDREVDAFYATTYLMDNKELRKYISESVVEELIENTLEVADKIEPFDFYQEIQVPVAQIPKFTLQNKLEEFYNDYEYIQKFSVSDYEVDRYYLYLIIEGLGLKNQELNAENLQRINSELEELYFITERLGQPLSSYFVLTKDIIDIMWKFSLVGVARGSAPCFYLNYLLDIVQINPIQHNLPAWRLGMVS